MTTATVGRPYVYDVTAAGQGNVQILADAPLPGWLTLVPTGNGAARLSGTPDAAVPGYSIRLVAQDNACRLFTFFCARQAFDIIVAAPTDRPPTVAPPGIADQAATVGQAFSTDVAGAFTDPDGDPLTFAAIGLPATFALTGSTITGTPTAGDALASPLTVTVIANDGRGGTVADSFLLRVVPLTRADVFIDAFTANPTAAARNTPVDWELRIGNTGPSPSGALQVSVEFAGNPVTIAANPCTLTVTADRQQLACTAGPIEAGATQTLAFSTTASQPGDVYATAAINAGAAIPEDPVASNNTAAASVGIGGTLVSTPAQHLDVGAVGALAAADVDGDGFADAALGMADAAPAGLLLDIEQPSALAASLAAPTDRRRGLASVPLAIGDAAAASDIAFADLDGDGAPDAVVAHGAGGTTAALRNAGGGSFEPLATFGAAARDDRALAVGDVDGDGLTDIVIASADALRLERNAGGGQFTETTIAPRAGAIDVVLADALGSPLPDAIVVYADGATLAYENLGGGAFGAAQTVDAGPATAVAAADFNGDGRADLVLARAAPDASKLPGNPVYLNNGSGGFVAVGALGAAPTVDVLAGDLDGDGHADVVAVNVTGAHSIYRGSGDGHFALASGLLVATGAKRGAIAPIGKLGKPDIVLAGADGVDVFFNDGHGNFGLGDTTRPVITLSGTPDVTIETGGSYTDAGATATDDVDGSITPSVDNPVDPNVIGSYTITYSAMDSAGNAAVPVTRTVHVNARAATGGGGGALGFDGLLLVLALAARRRASTPPRERNPR